MTGAISFGLSALLAVMTLLPVLPAKAWWVRGWDFPRLPVAGLAAAEHFEDAPDAPDVDDHDEARQDTSDQDVRPGDVHVSGSVGDR